MKTVLFSTLLLLLILFSCKKESPQDQPGPGTIGPDTLSTGWSKINAPAEVYMDVFFTNSMKGYLISSLKIFKSTNGGLNWMQAQTINDSLLNIAAYGDDNAIFVARGNKLLVTNDGGATLKSISLADTRLSDAFFVSNTTAYAVGHKLWKTTDGGLNWTQTYDFGSDQNISSIYFLNETTGFVCTVFAIFKTIDGGITWNKTSNQGGSFTSFPDLTYGYVSSFNTILKTTNEGNTWAQTNKPSIKQFLDLHFATGSLGFVAAGNEIYKTEDSGNSWTRVVKIGISNEQLIELHFTDEDHGWACGFGGTVLRYAK